MCGISTCSCIYFEGKGFITKWDGAEDSDIEPASRGGLSDSMKRAAVRWGIGRVLYKMTEAALGQDRAEGQLRAVILRIPSGRS
ncbi:MAG: Rad52/Rad22 family DNA repair protein [Acutalibacteraceae bacterium]